MESLYDNMFMLIFFSSDSNPKLNSNYSMLHIFLGSTGDDSCRFYVHCTLNMVEQKICTQIGHSM